MSELSSLIPFFRLSQQNFLSEKISPKNKTLLTAEIRLDENNELWGKDDNEIKILVENNLKKMNILKNEKVEGSKLSDYQICIQHLYLNKKIQILR